MAHGNTVTIVGNLTRDAELKFTPSGSALCNFGLAYSRRWESNGEKQEATSFFDVTAWSKLAENAAESLRKGDRVVVTGRLEQRTWEDKDSGEKRSKVDIIADEISPSLLWATAETVRNERIDPARAAAGAGY